MRQYDSRSIVFFIQTIFLSEYRCYTSQFEVIGENPLDGVSSFLVAFLEDKFQRAGNVFEIIIHDVCYYFFLTYNFVVLYKRYNVCTQNFIGKNVFMDFLVARNTFDTNITKYFPLVWRSNSAQKFLLLLIIIPVLTKPFCLDIAFEPGSKYHCFSERFSYKQTVLKTYNFCFSWCDLV